MSAYFYEMYLKGICPSDLLWSSEDGFFDDDASDFQVRNRMDTAGSSPVSRGPFCHSYACMYCVGMFA